MNILIAEDDPVSRRILQMYLEKWGHTVVAAEDGAHAWESFQNDDFEIVVSDWMMPEVDGLELVRRIRSADRPGYVYVILLTSKAEKQEIVAGMEAGADDYLTKPFDRSELHVRIGAGQRLIELERSLVTANERMKRDLIAASVVQKAFLPPELPDIPGVSIQWEFRPCDELAGDMLNVIHLDEDHVCVYDLDVSGHGVRSALLAVTLSRTLSLEAPFVLREPINNGYRIRPPADVAAMLNQQFAMTDVSEQFFSIVYGVLNTKSGEFRFTNAGHTLPIFLTRGSETKTFETDGPPIGIMDTTFEEHCIDLTPGDRVYIYSDGVTEAMNPRGEMFGQERLISMVERGRKQSLAESLAGLTETLDKWRDGSPVLDDVSILTVEIPGNDVQR